MAGRNTILTPEIQARVCECLELGMSQEGSADYAGIGESTYYKWLARGRSGESPYGEFEEAVKKAMSVHEKNTVTCLQQCIVEKDPTAISISLSRRYPQRWGRWREQAHDVPDGPPQQSAEELSERGMIEALARGDADSAQKFLSILQSLNPEKWRKSAESGDNTGSVIVNFPVPNPKF